jgi:hypothetical protein
MAESTAEGKFEMIPPILRNTRFAELSDLEIAAILQMSESKITVL